jgi:hypothetical protein
MTLTFQLNPPAQHRQTYFRIREASFRRDLNIAGFDGSEDAWDRQSDLLLAFDGDNCVGGLRLSGGAAMANGAAIPLEEHWPTLTSTLTRIPLSPAAYCQPGRLALLPTYRQPEILKRFTLAMIHSAVALGYRHCVVVTGIQRSRLYRRLFQQCGHHYHIFTDIPVPAEPGFHDLPHLLAIGSLATVDSARPAASFYPQAA